MVQCEQIAEVQGQPAECTRGSMKLTLFPRTTFYITKKIILETECRLLCSLSQYRERGKPTQWNSGCACVFTPESHGVQRETLRAGGDCYVLISDDVRGVSLLQKAADSNPGRGIWFPVEMKTVYCSLSCWGGGGLTGHTGNHMRDEWMNYWTDPPQYNDMRVINLA